VVFTSRRAVVQVHGCFWHRHADPACPLRSRPRSNTAYWHAKLDRNIERDSEHERALAELGWQVLTIWECECRDKAQLGDRLVAFLGER
jgi:DNA mismatch endonuclease, patch repair protein